jgi:hypothetical protein
MRTFYRLFTVLSVAAFAFAIYAPDSARITHAQDKPLVCDSTLVTLLLVAEHNYDYLTNMEKTGSKIPNVAFGDYEPLLHNIMMMMSNMQQNMTQEQMDAAAKEDKMMGDMMGMSNKDIIDQYMKSMMMDSGTMAEATPDAMASMDAMTQLPTGALANEDPACTALRTDVEHFLLVHTINDMMMGDAMK